jgi:hypothetical protein
VPVGCAVSRSAVGFFLILSGLSACRDDSGESCDELRDEYERLYPAPDASTSWSDIQALQLNAAEGLALQARIAERCG